MNDMGEEEPYDFLNIRNCRGKLEVIEELQKCQWSTTANFDFHCFLCQTGMHLHGDHESKTTEVDENPDRKSLIQSLRNFANLSWRFVTSGVVMLDGIAPGLILGYLLLLIIAP